MDHTEWILRQLEDGPAALKDLKARFDMEHLWFLPNRIRRAAYDIGIPWLGKFDDTDYRESLRFTYALRDLVDAGRVRFRDRPMGMSTRVKAGVHPDDLRPSPELREYYRSDCEVQIKAALAKGELTYSGPLSLCDLMADNGYLNWHGPPANWSACLSGLIERGEVRYRAEYPKCEGAEVEEDKPVEERWTPPSCDEDIHVFPTRYYSLAEGSSNAEVP